MKLIPYIVSGAAILVLALAVAFMRQTPFTANTPIESSALLPHQLERSEPAHTGATTSVTASKKIPQGWKTYRNEKFGFEVSYPADWIVLYDNVGDEYYLNIASTSTTNHGTGDPSQGPWIEVKKPLTADLKDHWHACGYGGSDNDGSGNDFIPSEGDAIYTRITCHDGMILQLNLWKNDMGNKDYLQTLNVIAESFATFKESGESVYRVGDMVDVSGTIGEILADDLGEIMTQQGHAPLPVLKITLDKQYIHMGEGDVKEEIYGIRMNYGKCVQIGLKSKDKVRVKGMISAIPMDIGLVLSCDDPSVSVQKI